MRAKLVARRGTLACRRGCLCRHELVGRVEGVVPEGGRLRCQNFEASFQVWRGRKQELLTPATTARRNATAAIR